jgi:hypothetical protein
MVAYSFDFDVDKELALSAQKSACLSITYCRPHGESVTSADLLVRLRTQGQEASRQAARMQIRHVCDIASKHARRAQDKAEGNQARVKAWFVIVVL